MWRQAGTGALFLAASQEMNLSEHHNIVPNGYDIGRSVPRLLTVPRPVSQLQLRSDKFVASAVAGSSVGGGIKYKTVAQNVTGLLPAGADGVNHGQSMHPLRVETIH